MGGSLSRYKTLADVLNEQARGERVGKRKVIIVKGNKTPKNIFYLQALGIAFNHMNYESAKEFVDKMNYSELKTFVNDWLN